MQARVGIAQAQLEQARGALQAAQANHGALLKGATTPELDQLRAGANRRCYLEPGEVALTGGALLVLGDLQHLKLTVYLPEDQYGTVKVAVENTGAELKPGIPADIVLAE